MKKIEFAVLLCFCLSGVAMVYGNGIQEQLGTQLLRLHIVANSDSLEDQEIKLEVRDRILEKSNENSGPEELLSAAESRLSEMGVSYGASGSLGQYYVPVKSYKNLKLPGGTYRCMRIILGEGKGENWWCIAYPPLCFSEDMFGGLSGEGEKRLAELLDSDALNAIVDSGGINFRFKIVEAAEKMLNRLK